MPKYIGDNTLRLSRFERVLSWIVFRLDRWLQRRLDKAFEQAGVYDRLTTEP